jgi:hypothetical protein
VLPLSGRLVAFHIAGQDHKKQRMQSLKASIRKILPSIPSFISD